MKLANSILKVSFLLSLLGVLSSCGPSQNPLDEPSFQVTGSGTYSTSNTPYVFANSSGAVTSSSNTISANFPDNATPYFLSSYNSVFADQLNTGSCSSLGSLVASTSGSTVSTNFSATGCTDQATVNISLDTTQVWDQFGYSGDVLASFLLTVDLAPKVTSPATGNTAADGSGTTEASSGYFALGGGVDSSIVVTFSKSLTGGTLTGSLTGCAATLGTPNLVTGSNGTTVAWPLGNLGGVSAAQSCTLHVSTIADALGNPEDPTDSNLTMSFTFH